MHIEVSNVSYHLGSADEEQNCGQRDSGSKVAPDWQVSW